MGFGSFWNDVIDTGKKVVEDPSSVWNDTVDAGGDIINNVKDTTDVGKYVNQITNSVNNEIQKDIQNMLNPIENEITNIHSFWNKSLDNVETNWNKSLDSVENEIQNKIDAGAKIYNEGLNEVNNSFKTLGADVYNMTNQQIIPAIKNDIMPFIKNDALPYIKQQLIAPIEDMQDLMMNPINNFVDKNKFYVIGGAALVLLILIKIK